MANIAKVFVNQNFYADIGYRNFRPNGLAKLLLEIKGQPSLEYKFIVTTLEEYKFLITTMRNYPGCKITPTVSNTVLYPARKISFS
jgi:hypothetical protein